MGYTTSDEWDTHYASGKTFRYLGDAERQLLTEHAPAPQGGLALDISCGLGELARHLGHSGYQVDAVDSAPSALTHAQAQDPTVAVTYRHFDIERDSLDDLPHPAYDLITFRLSWAFIHDRTRVMNRLRPGGALCVITLAAETAPKDKRDIALDENELELLRAGWSVADRHDADGLALLILRHPTPPPPRPT